jgi:F0F1-type ATP synthase delta subunit
MSARPSRKKLAIAIADLMDEGLSVNKLAKETAAYMLVERRTKELPSLMRDVMNERARRGTVEATATSAFALEKSIKHAITEIAQQPYPHAKQVILHEEHDPAVIGGVHIVANDRQLDLTIHSRLQQLTTLARPA